MRFKSSVQNGYQIYAITGVNTVSFAIDFENADTADLLGFAVERADPQKEERYFMYGFKVFKELVPYPSEYMLVSTFDNPVQSFVWDDFTAHDDSAYTYYFHPVKGRPKNLTREAPVAITVRTEMLFSEAEHSVFFNRGVASSQAYARRFDNVAPGKLEKTDKKKYQEALDWLSRDLDDAILTFIRQAAAGDTLLGCFYEFSYREVLEEFKAAIERGVNVRIIIDAKENKDEFPRRENLDAIREAGLPEDGHIIRREARKSAIQHNKFIVYLTGDPPAARQVFTGSTNISLGGIMGQTNVGHWLRNESVAARYAQYWEILSRDPGGRTGDSRSQVLKKNAALRKEVTALQADVAFDSIPDGTTPVFSPRTGTDMLTTYGRMVDEPQQSAAITLPFGLNKLFRNMLKDNTEKDRIVFMLLEKKDGPNPNSKDVFFKLGAWNNIYQAYGCYLKDPLYHWAKETNTRGLQLNHHVSYIHTKLLLMDPLSDDPVIVTGSANFSEASLKENDENALIIRKDLRAADIYFTEFNRLFNHYYFRSVIEDLRKQGKLDEEASIFLAADDTWTGKYRPGTFRYKRLQMFREMEGITP